jgi:hypothetical protein
LPGGADGDWKQMRSGTTSPAGFPTVSQELSMIHRDSLTITCLWHVSVIASALGLMQFTADVLALMGGSR